MSCLDGCCQQDEATGPSLAQTSAWSDMPDLEVPNEPADSEVNGLEAMTSLAILKPADESTSFKENDEPAQLKPAASFKESWVKTDFEILRGITLRQSLRRGGSLWSTDPQYLEMKARVALYERSRPVNYLDVFLSHSWASKGRRKILSLLLQSGCNHALLFWFLGILLAVALCYADVLPMPYSYSPGAVKFNEVCPLGPWAIIFGFLGTFFGLMLSPYLPSCTHDKCFIDVACVHQADPELTRRGIQGIGGFLAVAKELRILWSPVYMTRLWCVFEVATYKKINPDGKVVLAPIFLETIVILFYAAHLCASISYWTIRGAGNASFVFLAGAALLSISPFMISVHLLRKNYKQKHQLFADFANFDLDSVQCFSDSDRDFIHSTIAELYGSKEAFTNYVRGPLLQELLGPMTMSATPEKYGLLMLSPGINNFLDITLGLVKGNAPPDVVLFYVVSVGFVGIFYLSRSALKLLLFLCDRFAEPCVQRSVFFDCFQTFLIFLPFLIYFALVTQLCLLPFQRNRWELVPGVFLGIGLVTLVINWLQRRSYARWLSKKSSL